MAVVEVTGIHRSSKRSLIEYLNRLNSGDADHNLMIFGTPQPTAGTWYEDTTDRNTVIRITANEESKYQGTVLALYDRLDVSKLPLLIPSFRVNTYLPETTHDIVDAVKRRYGVFLDKEDVLLEQLVDVLVDNSNPDVPVYRLTMASEAIGWVGQLDVPVGVGDALLADYLSTDTLPGLNYPVEGDGTNGSALMYFYGVDFTDWKDTIETIPEGTIFDETSTAILSVIQEADTQSGKNLWNLDPAQTQWSLHGAEVVYNGLNDSALPTKSTYKYVMGIQMRGDMTTPPGVAYLHYNDPFDPDQV